MKHIDLFSGIGGFALATEIVWDNVEHLFCDNEPFAQAVISKHWPEAKIYGDIRTLTNTRSKELGGVSGGQREEVPETWQSGVDILTGGFPCQPFSHAGRRKGTDDDRYLWPEMLRVIREFHPRWVIGENVGGLVTWSEGLVLEQVHIDLENEGYEVQAFIIPAVSVNTPHRRDRVWIIAHSKDAEWGCGSLCEQIASIWSLRYNKPSGSNSNASDTISTGEGECGELKTEGQCGECSRAWCTERPDWSKNWIEVASRLCRVDDGLPKRMDRTSRLKGLGNAIVPQVAAEIMFVIKYLDDLPRNQRQ